MSDRVDDYTADMGYTHGYYAELSPMRARLTMLGAGFAAPGLSTACELGFGQGVSLAIHAAVSSTIWYGNDFNTEHMASASALLEASGAKAHLYQDSFIKFATRKNLPDFDYIGLNGVWSWISDESQAAIVDFVRKHLKVGGVFFVSYITLPGWAPYMPLRELLAYNAGRDLQDSLPMLDRIDTSLDFARRFLATTPAFFADNPAVAEFLTVLDGRSRMILAHDFCNRNYRPMYFSTVASRLMPAGLSYVGPANIGTLESVYLTRPQRELLGTIADPVFRETVHDFLVNRYMRRDLWIKGPATRLDDRSRTALLREVRIVAATPRPELPVKLRAALALNGGPGETVYRPLVEMLSNLQPISLAEIEYSLAPAGATFDQILDVVLLMAGREQLEFLLPGEPSDDVRAQCARLNTHLLEAARSRDDFGHLASPITGAGVSLKRRQQLFLLAYRDGADQPEALANFARAFLPSEMELDEQARSFIETDLPLLKMLGIA